MGFGLAHQGRLRPLELISRAEPFVLVSRAEPFVVESDLDQVRSLLTGDRCLHLLKSTAFGCVTQKASSDPACFFPGKAWSSDVILVSFQLCEALIFRCSVRAASNPPVGQRKRIAELLNPLVVGDVAGRKFEVMRQGDGGD